ncbi:MAG: c-type cytochrome [Oceanicoccus sp.]
MNRIPYSILMFMLGLSLTACSNSIPESTANQLPALIAQSSAPLTAEEVSAKWSQSCALCHASGVGGAPRIGVSVEWAPRLAKGKAVLMTNTIDGFNDMPPLGYCMSCDRDDFSALIDFMAGESP